MATALQVADYFLAVAPEGDITNLKLQKLCAYAQAISLAYAGKPLFDEDIQAWTHGPVIPSVYNSYKDSGSQPIKPKLSWDDAISKFEEMENYILQMTWAAYGRFTAWALRDQSHWDFPGRFGSKLAIPQEHIKEAFQNNKLVQKMRRSDTLTEAQYALDI